MWPPTRNSSALDSDVDGLDLDIDRHREYAAFAPRLAAAGAGAVVLLLAAVPRFGFGPIAALALVCVVGQVFERVAPATASGMRSSVFVQFVVSAQLGVVIVLTGGAQSFVMSWVVALCLLLYVRHPKARATKLAWATFAIALLPLVVSDPSSIIREPFMIAASTVSLLVINAAGGHLASTEIRNRGEAVIDPLTGLLNRRSLQRRVEELRQQGEVLGVDVAMSLILVDVDHFKRVNDTFGHAVGDGVLKDVAYELRKVLRQFDAVFRIGGEEFVVLVPNTGASDAAALAERLRHAVAARAHAGVEVTISLGVASSAMASADLDMLLERADAALYRAKDGGRNRVEVTS